MEVISILSGKPLFSVETILTLYKSLTEQAEEIANKPSQKRVVELTGRGNSIYERRIRDLQERWANLNSQAPHVGDNHPDVVAYRQRFLKATCPNLAQLLAINARPQEEEDMYAMYCNRDFVALDAFAPVC